MQSTNKRTSAAGRKHLARVKALPCSVCDAPPPSEAHHIDQRSAYSCVALCAECHRGSAGWHGTRALWRIKKMSEVDALYRTIERLMP